MADVNNNIATNEEALNTNNLTSDISNTAWTPQDIQEMNETGNAQIASDVAAETPVVSPEATIQTPVEAIAEWADITKTNAEWLANETAKRQEEDLKVKEDLIVEANSQNEARVDIIETASKDTAKIEKEASAFSQNTTDGMVDLLEQQKNLALEKSELELAEQKAANASAVFAAEVAVETNSQKATWAFQKLGLWFSSGIILEVQRIATQGATKIAELKITASKQEAETAIQINQLELDYTKEINGLIGSNLEVQLNLKQDAIDRIEKTNTNVLLSEVEKQDKVNAITADYISQTRENEDNLRTEQERLSDKYIEQTKDYQAQLIEGENIYKTKINDALQNGSLFNMSQGDIISIASKAGMTPEEVISIKNNTISSAVNETATRIMDDSTFIFSNADKATIMNNAEQMMLSGNDFTTAVESATLKMVEGTEQYKDLQKIKKLDLDADISNTIASMSAGSWVAWTADVKGSDIIKTVLADGRILFTNRLTEESFVATEKWWATILVPTSMSKWPISQVDEFKTEQESIPYIAPVSSSSSSNWLTY